MASHHTPGQLIPVVADPAVVPSGGTANHGGIGHPASDHDVGPLIEGFDEAIVGMGVGQSKTVTVPPEKGYGERSDERVIQAPRAHLPEDAEVEVGDVLEVTIGDQQFPAPVTAMDAESVTLDLNPPLAGHTLVFDLTLVAIAG